MSGNDDAPWAWREEDEALLESWRRSLVGYRFMHKKCARDAKSYHVALKLPAMVLSAAAGTALLSTGGSTERSLAGAASFIVATLTAADEFFRFQERAARHFAAAGEAGKLLGTITAQLALPRKRRTKARAFVEQCAKDYDHVLQLSSDLPARAVRAFAAHVRKHGVVGEETAVIQMSVRADETAEFGNIDIV